MRIAAAPERWLAFFILVCGVCSTGCTLIGLGIGAAVPRWERDVPPENIESYRVEGKPLDVDVQLRPGVSATAHVHGSFAGAKLVDLGEMASPAGVVHGVRLVVATDEGERRIKFQDVQRLDVRRGSHWLTGLKVGVAVEVTLLVTLAAILLVATGGAFGPR